MQGVTVRCSLVIMSTGIISGVAMKKSDLIDRLSEKYQSVEAADVERAVKEILEVLASTLQKGQRIEIRGFGSFSLRYRGPRPGRNPKTGQKLHLSEKCAPHFKAGKELRERVNASFSQ